MREIHLDPTSALIRPPDAADRYGRAVLDPLVASMKRDGWKGRPLLAEEVKGPGPTRYHLWTGSHRLRAAREAGLPSVPCLLITQEEADEAFTEVYSPTHRHQCGCWRGAVTLDEGRYDTDKLEALLRVGLDDAADLMRQEIEANEAEYKTSGARSTPS